MANFDLLDAVLPTEGRYCVIGVGKYADQTFWDTREEVDAQIAKLLAGKFDVYFGCAKFGALNNRTHANAKHFRALWIDIDCGPTKGVPDEKGIIKGYLTQDDGMMEFRRFCKEVGLPRPIMVNSGYGIHAYWLLEETIDRREWEPLSNRLRDLCVQHNLIVDASVFEASRVLRVPGTKNFKYDTEADVDVINDSSSRITYQQMKDLLGAPDPVAEQPDFLPKTLSPMMEAMLSNKVKRFKTIMIKSAKEEGCQQLLHCYENQESISYDMWRSSLSITAFCVDGDMASHRMSEKYPDYDRAEVDKKIDDLRRTGGPHHCTTFEKWNPGGCDGCIHKGKITSPIVIGIEVLEADDGDNEVVVEEDGQDQTYQIPVVHI
jgi:hypothetical protein